MIEYEVERINYGYIIINIGSTHRIMNNTMPYIENPNAKTLSTMAKLLFLNVNDKTFFVPEMKIKSKKVKDVLKSENIDLDNCIIYEQYNLIYNLFNVIGDVNRLGYFFSSGINKITFGKFYVLVELDINDDDIDLFP